MGTCYSQPDYTLLYNLLEEFNAGELLPLPGAAIWNYGDILSSTIFSLAAVDNTQNPQEVIQEFTGALDRYVAIHRELFGSYYEGELMPRPSDEILENELNMTFAEFLEKHNVSFLSNFLLQAHTTQGYGQLDETPALYGLIWATPNFAINLLNPPREELSNAKLLSNGYQTLWKEIVDQENINVRLSSPIRKIIRKKNGKGKKKEKQFKFTVYYNDSNGNREDEDFDFMVLTPEMKSLSKIINFNGKEKALFRKMKHQYYTTSLVKTTYGQTRAFSPQSYFVDNILSKDDMKVWVKRDSYNSLVYSFGTDYQNGVLPGSPDGEFNETSVYYQFSQTEPNVTAQKEMLRAHIEDREQATVLETLDTNVWPYFPQFSVEDTASGILWDIFDIQGEYGIWYAGSSVIFDSAKSVVEYNELLLRQYHLPDK